jgi:hypothetical protein
MKKTLLILVLFSISIIVNAQCESWPPNNVVLTATINITALNSYPGFIEFKCESDQYDECPSNQLKAIGPHMYTCDLLGNASQHIWFWMDTFDGGADVTIAVCYKGKQTILFDGHCTSTGPKEKRVPDICPSPNIFKTTGSPRLQYDKDNHDIMYIVW